MLLLLYLILLSLWHAIAYRWLAASTDTVSLNLHLTLSLGIMAGSQCLCSVLLTAASHRKLYYLGLVIMMALYNAVYLSAITPVSWFAALFYWITLSGLTAVALNAFSGFQFAQLFDACSGGYAAYAYQQRRQASIFSLMLTTTWVAVAMTLYPDVAALPVAHNGFWWLLLLGAIWVSSLVVPSNPDHAPRVRYLRWLMAIAPWLCLMIAMRQLEPTLSMTECLNRLVGPAILFGTQALAMYGGLQLMTRAENSPRLSATPAVNSSSTPSMH